MGETILCAAIWVDDGNERIYQPVESGLVFCGYRHHAILEQISVSCGDWGSRKARGLCEVQGFLTSRGRFVDRVEAVGLARSAGQIQFDLGELFSEDLY